VCIFVVDVKLSFAHFFYLLSPAVILKPLLTHLTHQYINF